MTDETDTEGRRRLDDWGDVEWIYRALLVACVAALAADLFYDKHPTLAVQGWFGFYAWYSTICSVVVVIAARGLRKILMRREDYYDR